MQSIDRQMQGVADYIDKVKQKSVTVDAAYLNVGRIGAVWQDWQFDCHEQVDLLSRTRDSGFAVALVHNNLIILVLEACDFIARQWVTFWA